MTDYYKLHDLDTVAKNDGKTTFIFDGSAGEWVVDWNHILTERLEEADGETMGKCERITEAEAQMMIGHEEDRTE